MAAQLFAEPSGINFPGHQKEELAWMVKSEFGSQQEEFAEPRQGNHLQVALITEITPHLLRALMQKDAQISRQIGIHSVE